MPEEHTVNEEKACELGIRILVDFEKLLVAKGIMVLSDDREGREEEAISKLVKAKKIKRGPIKGKRGSLYTAA